ncbi:MAG: replication initiator protein A, partial [Culicoidibacterales bacterium]
MKRISKHNYLAEQFYKMPKWLFMEKFQAMPNDAKIAYMFLNDRHSLSIQNNWIDDCGDIYFIFTRQELSELLGVGMTKTVAIFKSLQEFGLINDDKQGQGKPSRLYLLVPDFQNVKVKTFGKQQSRLSESETLDFRNLKRNKTDVSKTEFNETDVSCSLDEVSTNNVAGLENIESTDSTNNEQTIIADLQALNIPTTNFVVETVREWAEEHDVELLQAVIDKCVSTATNGVNLNYLKKAVDRLTTQGIKTLADLERAEELRAKQRGSKYGKQQRVEVMPKWEAPTEV